MKLDNLEIGMVVKNYKELCGLLEIGVKGGGNSKIRQMEWLEDYIKYEKQGHKFVIKSISNKKVEPLKDKRGGVMSTVDYPSCKVDFKDWKSIGVYKVTRGKEIYVGSTIAGFRVRFLGYLDSNNPIPTLEMLNNGATYEILQECNNMTEDEIRKLEDKYIKYYESMSDEYTLINERGLMKNKLKRPFKYKITKRFDTRTNNMVTEYKRGNKVLYEERHKIDNDADVMKMMEIIERDKEDVDEIR